MSTFTSLCTNSKYLPCWRPSIAGMCCGVSPDTWHELASPSECAQTGHRCCCCEGLRGKNAGAFQVCSRCTLPAVRTASHASLAAQLGPEASTHLRVQRMKG